MPKSTFSNLNANKRKNIIDAAIKEFSTVPFSKASVKGITTYANISRGSFYQYFENLNDIFFCILQMVEEQLYLKIIELLKKYDGDIFVAARLAFPLEIERVKKNKNLYNNACVAYAEIGPEINVYKVETIERGIRNILKHLNPVGLKSIDLSNLVALIIGRMHELSRLAIVNDEDDEILLKQFIESLKIIKFGVSKGI